MALALLFTGITVALLVNAAANPAYDFDGRMTWGTAAKLIAYDHSALPHALRDRHVYLQHPQYPILMPLAQVFVSAITGSSIEGRLIRPLYMLFLPALLLAIWPYLRRHSSATAGALAICLAFLSPAILWQVDGGAAGTYSDFPLAAFLGLGLLVAADARTRSSWKRGVLGGILLAGAVGCKNEGSILAGVVLACVWLDVWLTRRRAGAARTRPAFGFVTLSVLVVLCMILVSWWRSFIPNRNDESYLTKVDPSRLLERMLERSEDVLAEVARQLWDSSGWAPSLAVLAILVLVTRRGSSGRLERFSWAIALAQAALAFTAYIHLPNLDKVGSTLTRLVLQVSVAIVVLIACRLQSLFAARDRGSVARAIGESYRAADESKFIREERR